MPLNTTDERLLLYAPRGRDAEVMHSVLARDGFDCFIASGLEQLLEEIKAGAGVAIIAEEVLHELNTGALLGWLDAQEPWSDFPFVILASKPSGSPHQKPKFQPAQLGNVVILERPLSAQTLTSAAASALRARRRQYQARSVLQDRMLSAERLKASQADLLLLNQTLEARITERTRALAQANDRVMNEVIEKERVQQSMLQLQKMEAVGRLTGGIAHDFNNLLNVIQGSLDLILFGSPDEAIRRKAVIARDACERGGKLTSQLLAFSRNQKLDLRATNVRALFDGVRELITASIGSTVVLSIDMEDPDEVVIADMNQMEMALLNLAINARDAMPNGGRLRVTSRRAVAPPGLLPEGEYGLIAVSDTGSGIPEDLVAQVFEPFFTTKEVGKGTGLGLSQVYGMAQQSGGATRVTSEVGVGTTIEIWLRLATVENLADHVQWPAHLSVAQAGARILVVEDDEFVRQSIVDSLEQLGYQVSQAADGEHGLKELRRERPDLMITDYLMPGMTGAQLIHHANQDFPGLPMIIVTGYADMQAIDSVIGSNALLRKPFQLVDLAETVNRALTQLPPTLPPKGPETALH